MSEREISNNFTLAELAYYLYFAVMLTAKGLGFYAGQWPYTVALAVGAVLIVIKLLMTDHTLGEWIVIVLLFSLGSIIYIRTDEIGALIIIATVVGIKGVSLKRIMKLGCIIWITTYSLCIVAALLGLRSDIFRAQDKLGLGYIMRWSLGQPHPNVLQISCIVLCAFILYLGKYKGRKLVTVTIVLFVLNLYIFVYSISFTGIALAVFYLGLNLYLGLKGDNELRIWEKIIAIAVMPISLLFSVLGPNLLTGRIWEICNKLLNTRFNIAKTYMSMNPITLFGTGYCNELPADLNNLDCSYVYALMHYGVIFFIIFFGGYIALIINCVKENRKAELGLILAMSVAAISEPFFVNPSFKNISLIFLGEYFYVAMSRVNVATRGWTADDYNVAGKTITEMSGISDHKLVQIGSKEVILPVSAVEKKIVEYKTSLIRHILPVVISGIVIGTVAAGGYAMLREMPAAYYMNRDSVQVNGEHGFTLDVNNLPDDFDGVILEYTGPDRPMMRLDGNAVTLEYVRGILSMFVWCGLGFSGLTGMVFTVTDKKVNRC